jgi:hypothetical protein
MEAHTIRNRSTAMARAACAIRATNRWAITGTPIQNRITDFSSLLEFLQVYPFSNPKIFDAEVTKPWLKSADKDSSRMKRLVGCISLCRNKKVIDLPARLDLKRDLDFSPLEQAFYNQAKEGTIRKIDEALSSTPLKQGQYLNALQWLNELRLLCNHGLAHSSRSARKPPTTTSGPAKAWNKTAANRAFEVLVSAGEATCFVCGNPLLQGAESEPITEFAKPFLSQCLTLTCGPCAKECLNGQAKLACTHTPTCKSVEVSLVTGQGAESSTLTRSIPKIPTEHVSTKLKALLKDLQTCEKSEKR